MFATVTHSYFQLMCHYQTQHVVPDKARGRETNKVEIPMYETKEVNLETSLDAELVLSKIWEF